MVQKIPCSWLLGQVLDGNKTGHYRSQLLETSPNRALTTSFLSLFVSKSIPRIQLTSSRNNSISAYVLSSPAIRFLLMALQPKHRCTTISSPDTLPVKTFVITSLNTNPIGFIFDPHSEALSPGVEASRCLDHKQNGQWFLWRVPKESGSINARHDKHLNGASFRALWFFLP